MTNWGVPVLYSLYIYKPNQYAPAIFAVLYGISAAVHIYQCYHYKAFKLIGLVPLCAVLFALGYAIRQYGAYNYLYTGRDGSALGAYIASQVAIYVCPPLLELANYHILARAFHYMPSAAPVPASSVFRIFGGLMLLVELLNALGVSLSSNPTSQPATQSLGSRLTIAAIAIQLATIAIFFVVAGLLQRRLRRARLRAGKMVTVLCALYASMALILVRCVYRLVEHLGPTRKDIADIDALWALSPLFRDEIFFIAFEATLMLVNSMLWNVWNPARYLPRGKNVYLARDGSEMVRDEVVDVRKGWEKVAHVLTFGLLWGEPEGRQTRSRQDSEQESTELV